MRTMREPHVLLGDVTAPLDSSVSHIPSTLAIGVMVFVSFRHQGEVPTGSFLLFPMVIFTVIRGLQVAFELYGIFSLMKEHTLA